MSLVNIIKYPLFAPIETPAGGTPSPTGESKEDVIKFFEDDDEETEVIDLDRKAKEGDKGGRKEKEEEDEEKDENEEPTEDEEDEEDEEEDELKELEEELNKENDDEDEVIEPVRRKEIIAKYPKLFKDFPYLEKAYYREQQFSEIFPSIKDAKVASQKAEALENFEKELVSGNIETILSVVSKNNENAFNKMVDDLIPTLMKVNEKAGYHVIGNIIKDTIVSMVKDAKKSNNKELMETAKELNKFMFNSNEFEPPEKLSKEDPNKNEEDPIKKRERELLRREFERTRDSLNTKLDRTLQKTIEMNIDPRESMTPFVRKHATREALETVTEMISKDVRFRAILDKLWERTIKNNFNQDDVDKIQSAYITKARTLLPSVIKKARNEALKGMGKRVREEKPETEENEPEDTTPRKKTKNREAAPSENRGQYGDSLKEKARKIPANMSTRDYLMQD